MGERGKHDFTRRDFLRGTGLGALGWGAAVAAGCSRQSAHAPAQAEPPASPRPKPRVVIARNPAVVSEDGEAVDELGVRELVTKALMGLAGKGTLALALGQFIKPTDNVGIKSTVMMTPVHVEVLYALWDGLEELGVAADRVVSWDRGRGYRGYRKHEEMEVGFDDQNVATICSQFADALINVPALKSHWLSGIGVCLKNWAGAVAKLNTRDIDTPWPIHADSCADLGMLQAHPSIRDRVRLCVVDALRPLCHGGPQVNPQYLWSYGGIIVGTDAVAVDRVCLDIIQKQRNEIKGEEWPVSPPPKHIMVAAEKYGLGEADIAKIEVVEV
jgi:hypothetical protein